MFKFDEGVDAGRKFERFAINPSAPIGNANDCSIQEEDPGTPVCRNRNGKEFALNLRTFNVKDQNAVARIFKYELSAKCGANRVEVDPGIGNGGQN